MRTDGAALPFESESGERTLMTWPAPSLKLNGWPRLYDASNSLPLVKRPR